ncbi:unnamed protein product [Caenorhabditis bovis]|uniref:BTB domain-containing protein n=1 Tax=Caenorhabditis bovis TaxID=2654633 RepID=A0A8S1EFF5_9PELO|nr:unnamed protein product [Caenorhabditis bovis]
MSCIEVIDSKRLENVDSLAEKLKQETFDVNLPNGAQLIQHDEKAYENLYTNGSSFDVIPEIQAKDEFADEGIRFSFNFKLHPDGVAKMKDIGNTIQSNTLILQHKCVMYTYAYALTLAFDDEQQGKLCEFRLFPISHTFRHPVGMTKGGFPSSMKQPQPSLRDVTARIGPVSEVVELTPEHDGSYKCSTLISLSSLQNITKDGAAKLRVEMTIDENYFDVDEYVNLSPKVAPVSCNSDRILGQILAGEKVAKADWVITVGDGSPSNYHVHGAVLGNSSMLLRTALIKHMSVQNDTLTMVSHENRFILPKIKASDMPVILAYIYQKRFIVPQFDAVSRIGQFFGTFFREEIGEFFENWQATLVNTTMKLDRNGGVDTISECVKSLVCVHSAPQGALLAAYNVALVVAADAWQILDAKKEYENGKLEKKVKKRIGVEWPLIDQILEIIRDYREAVCGVEKSKIVC